jgi:D-glycero-D-manno-heptose 1,7-bisphosphate phosphatase
MSVATAPVRSLAAATDMEAEMLYCFDVDGTLVKSFMRDDDGGASRAYDLVEVLPGRRDKIERLAARPGTRFALVTNQAGVAFAYQSTGQVWRKLGAVLAAFEHFHRRPISVHVSFEHPNAKLLEYRADTGYRKPGPGMIIEAMDRHRSDQATTWMIGDMDSDQQAAAAAGVKYIDQEEFFNG